METEMPAPRPGRKRSDESRLAILTAAFELVGELGYSGLTIEAIATRSGTGKGTIRRWWPSKADVLLDALAFKADLFIPVPHESTYPADLHKFLTDSFTLGRSAAVVEALRALMAHAQIDSEFGERFRLSFLERRREALTQVISNAASRGDLPGFLSPGTIADIVFGVIWYRVLTGTIPSDDDARTLTTELVATLVGGTR
jgi:AcrR family transcriptional regulator